MKRPWEKLLPAVVLVTLGLLVCQFLYSKEELTPGKLYIHTVPSGANVFMAGAWSVHGFNEDKWVGRTPGPINTSIKEKNLFVFTLKLFGFEDQVAELSREEFLASPTIQLQPKWGFVSRLLYLFRDYPFLFLGFLLVTLYLVLWVRPQTKSRNAHEALWDLNKLQTGMRFHEYRLLEMLGEGAAGAVYRADKPEESSREKYTLKIFHRAAGKEDADLQAALSREFQNCAELSHPNIVYLLDWGVYRGYHYLVSEFVDGAPLDEVSEFTLADVCVWGRQITRALGYAHSQGIVHRDIKPANIMRTSDNKVKILDFGIAAKTDSEEESGAGSIGYMAPEQASGVVSPAGDFYSLGVTLYRLASGKMPFQGEDYFQILAAQATGQYIPLGSLVSNCPDSLTELSDRLLKKEPEQRLQDSEEICQLLEEAVSSLVSD